MNYVVKTKDFMVDLETLDTKPSTHILELALVHFNPVTGNTYEDKSINSKFGLKYQHGASVSTSTMSWWINENKKYFMELLNPKESDDLKEVLIKINTMFTELRKNDIKISVWNTGSFDVDVLNDAYKRLVDPDGILIKFYEVRDIRTLRQIRNIFPELNAEEVASHNAYEDCIRQIKYITDVTQALTSL